MSVREKPVANRYLDFRQKQIAYSKHVNAIKNMKASIDTSQPETPRRLMIAAVNNQKYRSNVKKDQARNWRQILEVEHRPQSARTTKHYIVKETFNDEDNESMRPSTATRDQQYFDIDIFQYDDVSTGALRAMQVNGEWKQGVELNPTPYITEFTDQKLPNKRDSVKIGYQDDPIYETLEIDDDDDKLSQQSDKTDKYFLEDNDI